MVNTFLWSFLNYKKGHKKKPRTLIYICFSFLANQNVIKLVLCTFCSFSHHLVPCPFVIFLFKIFLFFFLILVRIWIDIGWNFFRSFTSLYFDPHLLLKWQRQSDLLRNWTSFQRTEKFFWSYLPLYVC